MTEKTREQYKHVRDGATNCVVEKVVGGSLDLGAIEDRMTDTLDDSADLFIESLSAMDLDQQEMVRDIMAIGISHVALTIMGGNS